MTPENIIEKLKELSGASEAYHIVSTFELYRTAKDGHTQTVTVEVMDAGPEVSERYHCWVTSDCGKTATGNPQSSIGYALMTTHWDDLDKSA